ncbi:glutathione S-transferase family protein [Bradyrhizobium sp. STM 3562]|uniref:glutathione S-transferase family protein n=1 Tax=Bradyrhizobium sp. STM 3562 TaxID=578924 RepID=UPI00388D99BF
MPYTFQDPEPAMGKPEHLALYPFNLLPILRHGDFILYETSVIVAHIDEAFGGEGLTPRDPRGCARMNQWISAINSYFHPYMIDHVTHERLVFPELGIASDEMVVAHAVPKVELGLAVIERELAHGEPYLLGSELSLADF